MPTKVIFDMEIKIAEFCKNQISREPNEIHFQNSTLIIIFDPSLTNTEKSTLNTALPDFVTKLWKIKIEEI